MKNLEKINIYRDYIEKGGEISITLNDNGKLLDDFIIESKELKELKINLYCTLYEIIVYYLNREIDLYSEVFSEINERNSKVLKLLYEKNHVIESIELLDKYLKVSINLMKGGE